MGEKLNDPQDETAIRGLIDNWADAVRHKDMAGILQHHSPDMLMFDVPPPLQAKGIAAYAESWDLFFSWPGRPPIFDIQEMDITAGNDVAFVTAVMRCIDREADEQIVEFDFRLTVGLRKVDGAWIITHEHHSVPALSHA